MDTKKTVEHGTRARRVGEAVRQELALLLANEVKDPRALGAVITRVEMSPDLRSARIHVRLLESTDEGGAGAEVAPATGSRRSPRAGAGVAPATGSRRSPSTRRQALVEALERASGMLRRDVTRRLGLRYAPDLHFLYDDGLDGTARVEQLLAEIEAERRRG